MGETTLLLIRPVDKLITMTRGSEKDSVSEMGQAGHKKGEAEDMQHVPDHMRTTCEPGGE